MRTIIDIRDLLKEANKEERCPQCETTLLPMQCTVDIRGGKVRVRKTMFCQEHGAFDALSRPKIVRMGSKDICVEPDDTD